MAQRRVIPMVKIQLLYQIVCSALSTGLEANRCLPTVRTSRCNPMNPLIESSNPSDSSGTVIGGIYSLIHVLVP
jgi:hypothetical protein